MVLGHFFPFNYFTSFGNNLDLFLSTQPCNRSAVPALMCDLAVPMHKRKGVVAPHITAVIYCTAPFHIFTEPEIPDIVVLPWPTVMCEKIKCRYRCLQ